MSKKSGTENPFIGKEHVLNHTAQRFHLTRPSSVGPVMELIRQCEPATYEAWASYYWEKAYTKTKEPIKITQEIISELGMRLYEKIQGVIIPEWTNAFNTITPDDCIAYIKDVTIRRTYAGYMREKSVVYDNLAKIFSQDIAFEESDSDLDHAGDVDFIGAVAGTPFHIGIQVKPVTAGFPFSSYSPSDRMKKNFRDFKEKYGGNVFVVISEKEKIINLEIIKEIELEILHLRGQLK